MKPYQTSAQAELRERVEGKSKIGSCTVEAVFFKGRTTEVTLYACKDPYGNKRMIAPSEGSPSALS